MRSLFVCGSTYWSIRSRSGQSHRGRNFSARVTAATTGETIHRSNCASKWAPKIPSLTFSVRRLNCSEEAEVAQASAWRVNDAVAMDAMREDSATLVALLLSIARSGGPNAATAREELSEIRRDVLSVDGFDRRTVDALSVQFRERIRVLRSAP